LYHGDGDGNGDKSGDRVGIHQHTLQSWGPTQWRWMEMEDRNNGMVGDGDKF